MLAPRDDTRTRTNEIDNAILHRRIPQAVSINPDKPTRPPQTRRQTRTTPRLLISTNTPNQTHPDTKNAILPNTRKNNLPTRLRPQPNTGRSSAAHTAETHPCKAKPRVFNRPSGPTARIKLRSRDALSVTLKRTNGPNPAQQRWPRIGESRMQREIYHPLDRDPT